MKKEITPARWVVYLSVWAFALLAGLFIYIFMARKEARYIELVDEINPAPEPVIFEVDGINCVIAELPTLTYYVTTDSVRVTIECDSDILMHYLPAIPEGEAHE